MRRITVRLDKFVYDPNKSTGTVAIQATRGSFRFVTGSQGKGSYQIKSPYGTLGDTRVIATLDDMRAT